MLASHGLTVGGVFQFRHFQVTNTLLKYFRLLYLTCRSFLSKVCEDLYLLKVIAKPFSTMQVSGNDDIRL